MGKGRVECQARSFRVNKGERAELTGRAGGENRCVEIRKPGRAGLGSFETGVWNLKGTEELHRSSPFLQGCIGLCWMYILTLRVTILGANTLIS